MSSALRLRAAIVLQVCLASHVPAMASAEQPIVAWGGRINGVPARIDIEPYELTCPRLVADGSSSVVANGMDALPVTGVVNDGADPDSALQRYTSCPLYYPQLSSPITETVSRQTTASSVRLVVGASLLEQVRLERHLEILQPFTLTIPAGGRWVRFDVAEASPPGYYPIGAWMEVEKASTRSAGDPFENDVPTLFRGAGARYGRATGPWARIGTGFPYVSWSSIFTWMTQYATHWRPAVKLPNMVNDLYGVPIDGGWAPAAVRVHSASDPVRVTGQHVPDQFDGVADFFKPGDYSVLFRVVAPGGTLPWSAPVDVTLSVEIVPADSDGDGIDDAHDDCPFVANPDQSDRDHDAIGDLCNDAFDSDADEIADVRDNCPGLPNAAQFDRDGDGVGDDCDAHPDSANPALDSCQQSLSRTGQDLFACETNLHACSTDLSACTGERAALQSSLDTCVAQRSRCTDDLATSSGLLSQCGSDLARATATLSSTQASLTSCQSSLALEISSAEAARAERDACASDLALARSSADQCARMLSQTEVSLAAAEAQVAALTVERDQALAELALCRLQACGPDTDRDGEPDASDACAGTTPGAAVDALGCSQAQFCSSRPGTGLQLWWVCLMADWRNDEPGARPHDCEPALGETAGRWTSLRCIAPGSGG